MVPWSRTAGLESEVDNELFIVREAKKTVAEPKEAPSQKLPAEEAGKVEVSDLEYRDAKEYARLDCPAQSCMREM